MKPDNPYKGPSPLDRKLAERRMLLNLPRASNHILAEPVTVTPFDSTGDGAVDLAHKLANERAVEQLTARVSEALLVPGIGFDKRAYQREYMRKRRAAEKKGRI